MYTDLEIKTSGSKTYIEFYFDGVRQRIYSGEKIGKNLFPNKAKTEANKTKLLEKLHYEIKRALDSGWNPLAEREQKEKEPSLLEVIDDRYQSRVSSQISDTYRRDLKAMYSKLMDFLTPPEKSRPVSSLTAARVSEFLEQFNTSNSNYMTKRKTLNVLLPTATKSSRSKRTTEAMHEIYTKEQLRQVLEYLRENYPKLYLLALLTYGCLLRPHEEARRLQRKNVRGMDILLAGAENKGKRNRVIPIPQYVYDVLSAYLDACRDEQCYVFTGTTWLLNKYYFNTMWGRAKLKMQDLGILRAEQTLYSFRHTAAVNVYRRTKDVHLIQKMLGHSSVVVTLKYLRGLGEVDIDELRDAAPEL